MERLLCQPAKLGNMTLKNRMVMPPMVVRYASDDGFITERSRNYYEARAEGGVSLVILEATYVTNGGKFMVNETGLSDDRFIPELSKLAEAIHRHGAKAAIQLVHGGIKAPSSITGVQPCAPSVVSIPGFELPKELTLEEIREITDCFVSAALRVKRAGFNGVEIHGAHGFLIDQFLSRTTNKRNDEYGGGVENRARLLVQVIKGVKEAVGKDLSVWCRINGCEYGVTDGETLEDQKEVACMAEEAGADAIHVSAIGPTTPLNTTTARFQPALIADLAAGIKQAVKVPVIAVGRMTPESGEQLLAEGKADFIAFARALFADPELAKKVCENRYEDIRHCILCMGCRDSLRNLPGVVGVRCSVNAAIGRESECQITPAGRAKKVLVVGGGPAGMEAARVAALRGHKVTLWERDSSLGGQLKAAAVAPHKDRVATLTVYLETQLQKSKVIVELGKEATAAAIREFASDELVLATGGKVLAPEIPGLDKVAPVYAVDVLEGKAKVGQQVVIIGAELVACELAEYLADQGKNVSILRRGPEVAAKVSPTIRPYLIPRLEAAGVAMFTGVTYHQVTEKGLEITTKDGERKTLQGTIVIAAGTLPEQSLHNDVKNNISRVHLVGDCVNPRTIMDAISEGCQVGLSV